MSTAIVTEGPVRLASAGPGDEARDALLQQIAQPTDLVLP